MDFAFSEKDEQFRKEIRQFVKENQPEDYFGHFFGEEHDEDLWAFSMKMSKRRRSLSGEPTRGATHGFRGGFWES